jgi:hypothetical protein
MVGRRFDFIIAHGPAGRPWAAWLSSLLSGAGYEVTAAPFDPVPGSVPVADLDDALRAASRMLVVLTEDIVASDLASAAWRAAWNADPTGRSRRVIPIVVDETRSQGLLSTLAPISLVGLDERAAARALLTGIEVVAGRPSDAPSARGAGPYFPGTPHRTGRDDKELRRDLITRLMRRTAGEGGDERWSASMSDGASDGWFVELEADAIVEAEGPRRGLAGSWQEIRRPTSTLRTVRNLTRALQRSDAEFIRLEGDPGSGKSVALRRVALNFCQAALARGGGSSRMPIPLYLNLRKLDRGDRPVDFRLIRHFVQDNLRFTDDPALTAFAQDEFQKRLYHGGWLFLFDSFDEIPDILAATTDPARVVGDYALALRRFRREFGGRVVIASREFHNLEILSSMPRFKIRPLPEARQRRFIRRFGFGRAQIEQILGAVATSSDEFKRIALTPMFLAVLCSYLREHPGEPFPTSTHEVFERFILARMRRDEGYLAGLFGLSEEAALNGARRLAFCMSSNDLPLTSPLPRLLDAYVASDLGSREEALAIIGALVNADVATTGPPPVGRADPVYQFKIRRFQEYFATSHVLESTLAPIPTLQLVRDERWRDAAVTALQLHDATRLAGVWDAIADELESAAASVPGLLPASSAGHAFGSGATLRPFPWPAGALHVLGIVSASGKPRANVPPRVQRAASSILLTAAVSGTFADRRQALRHAGGTCTEEVSRWFLREGFRSSSEVLRDAAFTQTAQVQPLSDEMYADIRRTLATMAVDGSLRDEPAAVRARLTRLDRKRELLRVTRLLLWFPRVLALLYALIACWLVAMPRPSVFLNVYYTEPFDLPPIRLLSFLTHIQYLVDAWGILWLLPVWLLRPFLPPHWIVSGHGFYVMVPISLYFLAVIRLRSGQPFTWWPNRSRTAIALSRFNLKGRLSRVLAWIVIAYGLSYATAAVIRLPVLLKMLHNARAVAPAAAGLDNLTAIFLSISERSIFFSFGVRDFHTRVLHEIFQAQGSTGYAPPAGGGRQLTALLEPVLLAYIVSWPLSALSVIRRGGRFSILLPQLAVLARVRQIPRWLFPRRTYALSTARRYWRGGYRSAATLLLATFTAYTIYSVTASYSVDGLTVDNGILQIVWLDVLRYVDIVYTARYSGGYVGNNQGVGQLPWAALVLGLIVTLVMAVTLPLWVVRLHRLAVDQRRLRTSLLESQTVTGAKILILLAMLRTNGSRLQYLRAVRRRQLAAPDPDTLRVVNDLMIILGSVKQVSRGARSWSLMEHWDSLSVTAREWAGTTSGRQALTAMANEAITVLDELSPLSEDVQRRMVGLRPDRTDETAPDNAAELARTEYADAADFGAFVAFEETASTVFRGEPSVLWPLAAGLVLTAIDVSNWLRIAHKYSWQVGLVGGFVAIALTLSSARFLWVVYGRYTARLVIDGRGVTVRTSGQRHVIPWSALAPVGTKAMGDGQFLLVSRLTNRDLIQRYLHRRGFPSFTDDGTFVIAALSSYSGAVPSTVLGAVDYWRNVDAGGAKAGGDTV